jgi:hypothetical protein
MAGKRYNPGIVSRLHGTRGIIDLIFFRTGSDPATADNY